MQALENAWSINGINFSECVFISLAFNSHKALSFSNSATEHTLLVVSILSNFMFTSGIENSIKTTKVVNFVKKRQGFENVSHVVRKLVFVYFHWHFFQN